MKIYFTISICHIKSNLYVKRNLPTYTLVHITYEQSTLPFAYICTAFPSLKQKQPSHLPSQQYGQMTWIINDATYFTTHTIETLYCCKAATVSDYVLVDALNCTETVWSRHFSLDVPVYLFCACKDNSFSWDFAIVCYYYRVRYTSGIISWVWRVVTLRILLSRQKPRIRVGKTI